MAAHADTNPTVTITYDGTTATVNIPDEAGSYVSCPSGTSSHVKIVQTSTADSNPGEIIYKLSGTSDNGEFYLTGEYKTTIQLDGLTLTNPDSTAIHIKNGKRIKISMVSGTESTLVDGTTDAESKLHPLQGPYRVRRQGHAQRHEQHPPRHLQQGVCGDQELLHQRERRQERRYPLPAVFQDDQRSSQHQRCRRRRYPCGTEGRDPHGGL
ncbi:MAG: carbohydrate-binding domain-containing protein [Prevotella sp.]|nr:carbohydrate-binding domain-containing protein [Prevotella sp.]